MSTTPASIARAKQNRLKKMQPGTIVSFTTVRHPPAGFPSGPRRIAVIALEDGTTTMGVLKGDTPVTIGMKVIPRMSLQQINEDGLRTYDAVYEPVVGSHDRVHDFPGYIVALTGPSGVGKSTINKMLSSVLSEYVERVPILTTRKPSNQDKKEYQYISTEEFFALKKGGKLAAATEIPSSSNDRWYGYRAEDIQKIWDAGKIPSVVTEMNLLQDLERMYGRRSILSCGLLPPGKSKRAMLSALLHRLRIRGRDTEESIQDRLKNAEKDLAFFKERKELFDHMVVNEDLDSAVKTLQGHVMKVVA